MVASEKLIEHLSNRLSALASERSGYLVGYSGGRDSTVLLHALCALGQSLPVRAVHVHHGLHPEADRWAAACEQRCAAMRVPLLIERVNAQAPKGQSPEGWARQRRYQALTRLMRANEVLLTAHHEQDQAETILLQLLRGAGPAGLSSMPVTAPFAEGWHCRPLLGVPPSQLAEYATVAGLTWIEDPSNTDPRYDRNFIRTRVFPVLEERWPQCARMLSRAVGWQAEAAHLIRMVADADLASCSGSLPGTLSLTRMEQYPDIRQRAMLRAWFKTRLLPLPDARQLAEVQRLLCARADAKSCVRWDGVEVRRYRDDLFAMRPIPLIAHDAVVQWEELRPAVKLPLGTLSATLVSGGGLRPDHRGRSITIRYRQGGEVCRLSWSGPSRPLKHLLQEWGIPAWLRSGVPLIYAGDELVAVADLAVAVDHRSQGDEQGWNLRWEWDPALGMAVAVTDNSTGTICR